MEQTTPGNFSAITQLVSPPNYEIDSALPAWARRSNPIVRRELGPFWKRLLPNTSLLTKWILFQVGLVLLMPLEIMMTLTIPIAMLGIVLAPVVLLIYGRALVGVVNATSTAMVNAHANNTLDLLRVTHISLDDIVLGKIAAGIWQRMEDIDMVLLGITVFSLPFLTAYNLSGQVLVGYNLTARLSVAALLLVLPLRAIIEPFAFGAVALAAGAILPTRAAAVVSTLAFLAFYYVMLTMPLLGNLSLGLRLLFEIVLPLLLPLGITLGAVRLARWRIESQ